ncbi:MAG: amino-acid N-acetyltransferase [Treponema sp.]|jgi:amino-acid N-acetyltransferase|nr:amino-acid N-acetyltransferase [Treponema sp.]
MDTPYSQVELIREVFHYQSKFEGSTMVFKIDCPVTEDPNFPGLVKDLALLAKTGFKVVIVPGAKQNIDAVLKRHDIHTSCTANTDFPVRVTTSQAIPFVEMAAYDVAGRFMTLLSGSRAEALIGNFVRARGLGVKDGVDTEHTGIVDKIYADSLERVLNLGMVPILPCIGWSPSGKPYNVQSDEIALAVSSALKAEKLFIISIHDELRADFYNLPEKPKTRPDGRLDRLTTQEIETLIAANGNLSGRNENETASWQHYLRELKLARRASRSGVHRVHIVDGREEGSVLKELFSNLGVGTMIYADEYDSIRSLHTNDLPDILRLMEPLMQDGILIRRSAEQIQEKKDDYVVFEIDGTIHACGALHDRGESQAEIAAIATDPRFSDMGLGRRIVGFLIEKARKKGLERVFVLTTQTQDWFESLGFKEAGVETLPEQKRKVYDRARNSKVFALKL